MGQFSYSNLYIVVFHNLGGGYEKYNREWLIALY